MGRPKYNWDQICNEFVQGILQEDGSIWYPTLEEIAERYNIKARYLRKRAGSGTDAFVPGTTWYDLRRKHMAALEQKYREELAKARAKITVKFDEDCISAAKHGLMNVLAHFKKLQDQIVEGPDGKAIIPTMKPSELHQLSCAGLNWQKVGRLVLGETTEIRSDEVEVARVETPEPSTNPWEKAVEEMTVEEMDALDLAFSKLTGIPPLIDLARATYEDEAEGGGE